MLRCALIVHHMRVHPCSFATKLGLGPIDFVSTTLVLLQGSELGAGLRNGMQRLGSYQSVTGNCTADKQRTHALNPITDDL